MELFLHVFAIMLGIVGGFALAPVAIMLALIGMVLAVLGLVAVSVLVLMILDGIMTSIGRGWLRFKRVFGGK